MLTNIDFDKYKNKWLNHYNNKTLEELEVLDKKLNTDNCSHYGVYYNVLMTKRMDKQGATKQKRQYINKRLDKIMRVEWLENNKIYFTQESIKNIFENDKSTIKFYTKEEYDNRYK